jgi:hypothetical protein
MQSSSGCGRKVVRRNISLLLSLAGLKGLSGCAVRQNSKIDSVRGPIVLELEERRCFIDVGAPISENVESSSRGNDDDSSDGDRDFGSNNRDCSVAEQARSSTNQQKQMVRLGRAALAGILERKQAYGVNPRKVPKQDLECSTYTVEYGSGNKRFALNEDGRLGPGSPGSSSASPSLCRITPNIIYHFQAAINPVLNVPFMHLVHQYTA